MEGKKTTKDWLKGKGTMSQEERIADLGLQLEVEKREVAFLRNTLAERPGDGWETLTCRIAELECQLAEAKKYEHRLRNLLAYIHRDGGHYHADYGTQKATEAAIQIVCANRGTQAQAVRLRKALEKYGRHEHGCKWVPPDVMLMDGGIEQRACTCGFLNALADVTEQEDG